MKIFKSLSEWIQVRKEVKASVGFIPTMGALHEGHLKLVEEAKSQCDFVVVSIYLNPTQFNSNQDLEKYPVQLDKDIEKLKALNVDALITPSYEQIYPDSFTYVVSEKEMSQKLCGAHRPGHFDGVLTVVLKLLNLVKPQKAFFGEKDFQQLSLVQGMVKAFFLDVEIVPVPTIREVSGLAMSSRNQRLSSEEFKMAPEIFKTLKRSSSASEVKEHLSRLGFVVEYVEDIDHRRYIAAQLGSVRLIDNVSI